MVVEPPDSGVKRIVLEVKGRVKRWRMDAMVGKATMEIRKMRSLVTGFSLMVVMFVKGLRMRDMYINVFEMIA